jgi:response regulator NasT
MRQACASGAAQAREGKLRVAVVDDNAARAAIVEDGLRETGLSEIVRLKPSAMLLREIADSAPDVVIIGLGEPGRDILEHMFEVTRHVPRPIAMFVDSSDAGTIERAIEAGVSAYVVDGLRKERVRSVLDVAIGRYNAFSRLRTDLEKARSELEERKVVDRAKAILIQRRGLSEDEAHRLLRRSAMNENKRLIDVAQSIITASGLL